MSEGAKEIIQEMAEFIPDLEESDRRELLGIAKGAAMVRRSFNGQQAAKAEAAPGEDARCPSSLADGESA